MSGENQEIKEKKHEFEKLIENYYNGYKEERDKIKQDKKKWSTVQENINELVDNLFQKLKKNYKISCEKNLFFDKFLLVVEDVFDEVRDHVYSDATKKELIKEVLKPIVNAVEDPNNKEKIEKLAEVIKTLRKMGFKKAAVDAVAGLATALSIALALGLTVTCLFAFIMTLPVSGTVTTLLPLMFKFSVAFKMVWPTALVCSAATLPVSWPAFSILSSISSPSFSPAFPSFFRVAKAVKGLSDELSNVSTNNNTIN